MRMRRKKNLDEKLLLMSDILLAPRTEEKDVRKACLEKEYLSFEEIFGNDHPVMLEIGCGKGRFAIEFAKQHPEVNFLAMEKSANVIFEGCSKAKNENLANLRFINLDAKLLTKYFAPESISGIYLNFSCPYPQKSYANNRLTYPRFIKCYTEILKAGGRIFQKTDNTGFFEYSLDSFINEGYIIEFITRDLHSDITSGNIMTEYEKKFSSQGIPINALIAAKPEYES